MEPKFIADVNVGKLGRWLRILGYDVAIDRRIDDGTLVSRGRREGRIILTRDRGLPQLWEAKEGLVRVVLLNSEELGVQLRQVVAELNLGNFRPLSRCLECNQPLVPQYREKMRGRVPPYVFQTQHAFNACPGCGRIYWAGTHWARIHQALAHMLGEGFSLPPVSPE